MMRHFIAYLSVFLILGGCSTYGARPEDIRPDSGLRPVAIVKPTFSTGSLWPGESSGNSLFADNKARYVNDIVTIVIDESSSGQNKASTNTSKDTKTSAGISALLGVGSAYLNADPNILSKIGVAGTSTNALKGTGDTSRGGTLQARVAARVVRVMDNGLLVIEGRRQLTLNEENQYIVLTGVIRPDDITSDNLILSSLIADARIVYTGTGVINDKQRPGWLTRIVDWGWPF
jgi:flagellar L-ring protein precursor FlgH